MQWSMNRARSVLIVMLIVNIFCKVKTVYWCNSVPAGKVEISKSIFRRRIKNGWNIDVDSTSKCYVFQRFFDFINHFDVERRNLAPLFVHQDYVMNKTYNPTVQWFSMSLLGKKRWCPATWSTLTAALTYQRNCERWESTIWAHTSPGFTTGGRSLI